MPAVPPDSRRLAGDAHLGRYVSDRTSGSDPRHEGHPAMHSEPGVSVQLSLLGFRVWLRHPHDPSEAQPIRGSLTSPTSVDNTTRPRILDGFRRLHVSVARRYGRPLRSDLEGSQHRQERTSSRSGRSLSRDYATGPVAANRSYATAGRSGASTSPAGPRCGQRRDRQGVPLGPRRTEQPAASSVLGVPQALAPAPPEPPPVGLSVALCFGRP